METNRFDLLFFLNELFVVHKDLNENESLCYNMHENRLFSEDHNTKVEKEIVVPEYKCKPAEVSSAYDVFFVEGSDKKIVEGIFLHGMYFLPGKEEGSIVFSKEDYSTYGNKRALKRADGVTVIYKDHFSSEKVAEIPICDVPKKKNRFWDWLFWIFVISVIIYFVVMYL